MNHVQAIVHEQSHDARANNKSSRTHRNTKELAFSSSPRPYFDEENDKASKAIDTRRRSISTSRGGAKPYGPLFTAQISACAAAVATDAFSAFASAPTTIDDAVEVFSPVLQVPKKKKNKKSQKFSESPDTGSKRTKRISKKDISKKDEEMHDLDDVEELKTPPATTMASKKRKKKKKRKQPETLESSAQMEALMNALECVSFEMTKATTL
jgi:hypothetical protein